MFAGFQEPEQVYKHGIRESTGYLPSHLKLLSMFDDLSMQDFLQKSIQKTPSQQLPDYYRLNGAIYLCDVKRFLEEKSLFLSGNIFAYVMSRKNSIDIDDDIDFELASIYLSRT